MKRLLALLMFGVIPALFGQESHPTLVFRTTSPSGACFPAYNWQNTVTGVQYTCKASLWTAITGGGSGTDPYTATVTAQTTLSVTAATHGQGTLALAACFDNATPRNYVSCAYSRSTSGDVVFTWSPAFTGLVEIWGGGGSGGGGSGTVTTSGSPISTYCSFFTAATVISGDSGCTYAGGTMTLTGPIVLGSGGSAAGTLDLSQGSAPSTGTNTVSIFAPTSVTSYLMKVPGAAATGLYRGDNSSGTVTMSQSELSGDCTTSGSNAATCRPGILISTSGAVTDPGGSVAYQFNNAAGALTFNAPAGVAGLQRCYRNATGKSGVITVQMAASNTVDVSGTNGTSVGTLVSGGAAGDSVCLVSDASNHWYAYVQKGTWTNN